MKILGSDYKWKHRQNGKKSKYNQIGFRNIGQNDRWMRWQTNHNSTCPLAAPPLWSVMTQPWYIATVRLYLFSNFFRFIPPIQCVTCQQQTQKLPEWILMRTKWRNDCLSEHKNKNKISGQSLLDAEYIQLPLGFTNSICFFSEDETCYMFMTSRSPSKFSNKYNWIFIIFILLPSLVFPAARLINLWLNRLLNARKQKHVIYFIRLLRGIYG